MEDLIIKQEEISKAVENVLDYFDSDISFSQLQSAVLDGYLSILDAYHDGVIDKEDMRAYQFAYSAKQMLELLRPFAEYIGQGDKSYEMTKQWGETAKYIKSVLNEKLD